jgi:hypothetical protein
MRILRKISIAEISAVDRPANREQIAIMKRDGDDMTETEKEYLSDASPKEKATYLAADAAGRKKILAQDAADDANDAASKRVITKADGNAAWDRALQAYADRNHLTKSAAAMEFSSTIEAKNLYSKILRLPSGLSKAQEVAAQMDITCEVLAKQAFPNDNTPTAVAKFLKTDSGKEFYTGYLEEKPPSAFARIQFSRSA